MDSKELATTGSRRKLIRRSVEYQPANAHIKSVQLTPETWERAALLQEQTGMSFSQLVRTLLMSARVNKTARLADEEPTAE